MADVGRGKGGYIDDVNPLRIIHAVRRIILNDVLGVVDVHSDYRINLIKDMRNTLGGIKPGDKLVVIKVDDGYFIKKRQMKE